MIDVIETQTTIPRSVSPHRRTGRHFTGGAETFALKITICPKYRQFALKLTF